MDIQSQAGITIWNAHEADLRDAFANDKARGSFIILSVSNDTFIQSSNDANGNFDLEYRTHRSRDNFRAVGTFDKATILDAFLKYFNNDKTWRNDFTWEPLGDSQNTRKPWWKFW